MNIVSNVSTSCKPSDEAKVLQFYGTRTLVCQPQNKRHN